MRRTGLSPKNAKMMCRLLVTKLSWPNRLYMFGRCFVRMKGALQESGDPVPSKFLSSESYISGPRPGCRRFCGFGESSPPSLVSRIIVAQKLCFMSSAMIPAPPCRSCAAGGNAGDVRGGRPSAGTQEAGNSFRQTSLFSAVLQDAFRAGAVQRWGSSTATLRWCGGVVLKSDDACHVRFSGVVFRATGATPRRGAAPVHCAPTSLRPNK